MKNEICESYETQKKVQKENANINLYTQNNIPHQLATYWGVDQHTQKLSSHLTAIRAVLRDAERKQITSHAVKDWLQKLIDAAYVLDDILDECSLPSKKVNSDDGRSSFLARVHPKDILFRFHIGKRMKDITQRFHDINEERSMFELRNGVTEKQAMKDDDDDWRQTSSVITEPIFCGRDQDREKIVKFLLEDASKIFKKVESLRTFLDFGNIGELPSNHYLRALRTTSSLLYPLNDLAHLRYLSVCGSSVASMLNSICQLPKLQILKLEDVHHLRLPKELTQLQDLRHIVIDENCDVGEMPPNISKLRNIRTLSNFVVGSKAGCGLAELHSLKLGGTLRIEGLENVPNEWDAKKANLIGKKDLNILHLSWGGSANSEGSNVNIERILEALEPPSSLKSFGMKGYQGRRLSSWMRNGAVLRDLVEVILLDCNNCEELPPLGKLPQLKRLCVRGMENVKWIDGESYGMEEKAFPSLEKLTVGNLPKLERMLREEGVEMLPRLSQLTIDGISNLKFPRLPSVEELRATNIEEATSLMEGIVEKMPCLKTLKIEKIKGQVVLPDQLSVLGALQELDIGYWYNLEYFPEHVLEGLTSLQILNIYHCEKLKSLSEGVRHLTCLEILIINHCPELVALPSNISQLTALWSVSIVDCSTLPYGLQSVPSLRTLHIIGWRFTSLPEWLGDMTSLQNLEIQLCGKLRSLPSSIERLTNLSSLSINRCPYLKKRCKRETGEDWQYIKHIPEIEFDPYEFPKEKSSRFCESIRRSYRSWNCFKPAIKVASMNSFDIDDALGVGGSVTVLALVTMFPLFPIVASPLVSSRLVVVCVVSSRLFVTRGDIGDGLRWLLEGLFVETLGVARSWKTFK
ncbi:hypothetical protein ACSQ67_003447 [Phaseolus vulgaris]